MHEVAKVEASQAEAQPVVSVEALLADEGHSKEE